MPLITSRILAPVAPATSEATARAVWAITERLAAHGILNRASTSLFVSEWDVVKHPRKAKGRTATVRLDDPSAAAKLSRHMTGYRNCQVMTTEAGELALEPGLRFVHMSFLAAHPELGLVVPPFPDPLALALPLDIAAVFPAVYAECRLLETPWAGNFDYGRPPIENRIREATHGFAVHLAETHILAHAPAYILGPGHLAQIDLAALERDPRFVVSRAAPPAALARVALSGECPRVLSDADAEAIDEALAPLIPTAAEAAAARAVWVKNITSLGAQIQAERTSYLAEKKKRKSSKTASEGRRPL